MFTIHSVILFIASLFGLTKFSAANKSVAQNEKSAVRGGKEVMVIEEEDMVMMDATEGIDDDNSSVCSSHGNRSNHSHSSHSSHSSKSSKKSGSSKSGSSKSSKSGSSKSSKSGSSKKSYKSSKCKSSKYSSKYCGSRHSSHHHDHDHGNKCKPGDVSHECKCKDQGMCSSNPKDNVKCLRPRLSAKFGSAAYIPFASLAEVKGRFKRVGINRKLIGDDNTNKLNTRVGKFFVEVFKREQSVKVTCVDSKAAVKHEGPVCEGQTAYLSCSKNQKIKIVRASYGSNGSCQQCQRHLSALEAPSALAGRCKKCPSPIDATESAQRACNKSGARGECYVQADDQTFGSYKCGDVRKSLLIQYQCVHDNPFTRPLSASVPIRVLSTDQNRCKGKDKCHFNIQCS